MAETEQIPVNLTSNLPLMPIPPDEWIGSGKPYPWAIGFATLSLLVAIIITPPMLWHARNRNIGATVLVGLAIYANFQSFLNAVLWPHDDFSTWYNGKGLCDLEVNIQLAVQVAFPASLTCILKALAQVLDTDNAVLMKTKSQKRREYAIDIFCCLIVPLLQFPFHYFVQGLRYYVFGIAGCTPAADNSWLAIVLLIVPPFLWTLAGVFYAILILIRLLRYRRTISSVLSRSSTPKSRFFRLYLLCVVCVLGWFPAEIYILYVNIITSSGPYSWSEAHAPGYLDTAIYINSSGRIFYDRYIWFAGGIVVFFFFGFGHDAVAMYRAGLLRLGFGRIFPGLHRVGQRNTSATGTAATSQSKLRLLFSKSKDTMASFLTSRSSHLKSTTKSFTDDELSPTLPHSDATNEKSMTSSPRKPTFMSRLGSRSESERNILPMTQSRSRSRTTLHSTAFANPSSDVIKPLDFLSKEQVMVMKEIHQTSERNPAPL